MNQKPHFSTQIARRQANGLQELLASQIHLAMEEMSSAQHGVRQSHLRILFYDTA